MNGRLETGRGTDDETRVRLLLASETNDVLFLGGVLARDLARRDFS
jgi:hypothetical protein